MMVCGFPSNAILMGLHGSFAHFLSTQTFWTSPAILLSTTNKTMTLPSLLGFCLNVHSAVAKMVPLEMPRPPSAPMTQKGPLQLGSAKELAGPARRTKGTRALVLERKPSICGAARIFLALCKGALLFTQRPQLGNWQPHRASPGVLVAPHRKVRTVFLRCRGTWNLHVFAFALRMRMLKFMHACTHPRSGTNCALGAQVHCNTQQHAPFAIASATLSEHHSDRYRSCQEPEARPGRLSLRWAIRSERRARVRERQ